MTHKDYIAIKNWLLKKEKEIRDELHKEGESPLVVEREMPKILSRLLASKGIDADEFFKIDSLIDSEGAKHKEMMDLEIDVSALEEEKTAAEEKTWMKSFVKDLINKFKKTKKKGF